MKQIILYYAWPALLIIYACGCGSTIESNQDASDTDTGEVPFDTPVSDTPSESDALGDSDDNDAIEVVDAPTPDTTPDAIPETIEDGEELDATTEHEDITFPLSTDTHTILYEPYMYTAGDQISGIRTLGLASVSQVDANLDLRSNTLISGTQARILVYINDTLIGTLTISNGDASISDTFSFSPVTGPDYTIRIELEESIRFGDGSIWITDDITTWTFYY